MDKAPYLAISVDMLDTGIDVPEVAPLDAREPATEAEVRQATAKRLHTEVASMSTDNFLFRPKRQWVEKYARPEAWTYLSGEAQAELSHEVAGLPSDLDPESEEAKRFDLLLLNLQLALLKHEQAFERLKAQVVEIAGLLEEKAAIPSIKAHLPLIQDLQSEEWWEHVTLPKGPEGLFTSAEVDRLMGVLDKVKATARAA